MNPTKSNFPTTRSLQLCSPFPLLVLAGGLSLLCPNEASSVGFRLPNQDPEGIARGNAFVATADNPSAIYYNPAGITQLKGDNVSAGLYFISADTEYKSAGGAKAKTDDKFQPVPQLYYVHSLKETPVSFGLGIYAPYGLSLDYGDKNPFRNLAISGKLLYVTVNPVAAWQIHPTLSIGAGPTINYAKANLKRGIGFLPNDEFKFEGDGSDVGFNAGIRWQPVEKWAFGVNYRSSTTIDFDGESEARPFARPTDTHGAMRFPQFVDVGVSYRPTPQWNLEVNVDWTDWDDFDKIDFKGTTGGKQTLLFNYQSSLMYEFGVTRKFGERWFASVGYIFSENSSPDKNFNPIIPDSDLHLGSFGFGRKGDRWDWAVGYHFAFGERSVRGSQPGPADGNYRTFNNAVNVSTTLKF